MKHLNCDLNNFDFMTQNHFEHNLDSRSLSKTQFWFEIIFWFLIFVSNYFYDDFAHHCNRYLHPKVEFSVATSIICVKKHITLICCQQASTCCRIHWLLVVFFNNKNENFRSQKLKVFVDENCLQNLNEIKAATRGRQYKQKPRTKNLNENAQQRPVFRLVLEL